MRFLCIALFSFIVNSHASELHYAPETYSSLSYTHGYDSDKNKDDNLYVDLEFSNYQRLNLGYTRSRSASDDSITYNYLVSTSTSTYKIFSLGVTFNLSHAPNALETTSLGTGINLNLENWQISLVPKLSTISLYLNANKDDKFSIASKGIGLTGSYFGLEPYFFSSSYSHNFYSNKPLFLRQTLLNSLDIRVMNKIRLLARINQLGSSLENKSLSMIAGRSFNWGNIDFSWTYIELFNIVQWLEFTALKNATETSVVNILSTSLGYYINRRLSATLSMGWQSISTESDKLIFSSAEISYNW